MGLFSQIIHMEPLLRTTKNYNLFQEHLKNQELVNQYWKHAKHHKITDFLKLKINNKIWTYLFLRVYSLKHAIFQQEIKIYHYMITE